MENSMKLPIGIENFEKLRKEGFYYVDKTGLIKELLESWGEVNLFTRPRRFGKSLNMNMLQYFFEYGCNPELFEGLAISEEKGYCEKYMGKFPVISITLKDVNARSYESAEGMLGSIVGTEALRFRFLLESSNLSKEDKERYQLLIKVDQKGHREFSISKDVLVKSLNILSGLLCKHYKQKVILLIDEYDVPLDKAQQSGYYDDMVDLLRNLLSQALKTNDSLYFAVLTGCLRIAKESIFTGLNNLNVFSITNSQFGEYFGFSDKEVEAMLEYYGHVDKIDTVKIWYDGYRFGNTDVYCPWDVINYCRELRVDHNARPRAYWINTSGNDIIRKFIQMATPQTKRDIEALVAGETVIHRINQELTYRDLYKSVDNLWSVLFTTGYLTQREFSEEEAASESAFPIAEPAAGMDSLPETYFSGYQSLYRLAIPNLEIRQIFVEQIMEWFQEEVHRDTSRLDAFCDAFSQGDTRTIEESFNNYLRKTISIRDMSVRKPKKENFYHGILLGLLSHREDWILTSNSESGDGYSDILIESEEENIGIVIEVKYLDTNKKYPADSDLEKVCKEALDQIERVGYATRLKEDGMGKIMEYGIVCYKKRCRVQVRGFC